MRFTSFFLSFLCLILSSQTIFALSQDKELDYIRIYAQRETNTDETIVAFIDGATNDYDDYDTEKMFSSSPEIPQVYTVVEDDIFLAINSFPLLTDTMSVNLGFRAGVEDNYKLYWANLDSFDDSVLIYMVDNYEDSVINVREQAEYIFSSEIVDGTDRFTLRFRFRETKIWTGMTNSNWNFILNWYNGIPDIESNAIIPGNGIDNFPIVEHNGKCRNLFLNAGSEITIEPTGSLTVGRNITFESPENDNTPGSLIDLGELIVNGNSTYERFLDINRWWYLTSPVSNATSQVFDAEDSANHKVYFWNEPNGNYNQIYDDTTNLFGGENPIMTGYAVKFKDADKTLNFTGDINSGEISYTLSRTTDEYKEGFNLIGNPYPSAVDWDHASWTKTNIDAGIYFRSNGAFHYYVDNVSIPDPGSSIIPAMQAFWVRVSQGFSEGTIACNNNVRVHNDKVFYKEKSNNLLRIHVSSEGKKDEIVLCLKNKASRNFDSETDAYKLFSSNLPGIYSVSDDNIELAINSQPLFEDLLTIPIYVKTNQGAEHKLEFSGIDSFDENYEIKLIPAENVNYAISNDFEYNFIPETGLKQFLIKIIDKSNVTISSFDPDNFKIIQHNKEIIIKNLIDCNSKFDIYTIAGKKMKSGIINAHNETTVSIFDSGIYFINIISPTGISNKKILIK